MGNNLYSNLHGKYSVSKTLRFELKPIGKTLENIEKKGFLPKDEHRAITYKRVKKYCDEYHKGFIEKVLNKFELDNHDIDEYYNLYKKETKTDEDKKAINVIQTKMRKQISDAFKKDECYKGIFEKIMIEEYLIDFYKNDAEKANEIREFSKFTSYFTNYNATRKNLYEAEDKASSIAYRLINENLPTYFGNYKNYLKIKSFIKNDFDNLYKDLNEYINYNSIDELFDLVNYSNTLTQKSIEAYNIIISGKSKSDGTKIKGINEYINKYNQDSRDGKLPKLAQLHKQLLSDKSTASFVIETIEDDNELIECLTNFQSSLDEIFCDTSENSFIYAISNISKYDCEKIYLNNSLDITEFSNSFYGEWNKISEAFKKEYDEAHPNKKNKNIEKYNEQRAKDLKSEKVYSLNRIQNVINDETFITKFDTYVRKNALIENIKNAYFELGSIIAETRCEKSKVLIKDENAISKIKCYLDAVKSLQEFVKKLLPKDNNVEKDMLFYSNIEATYNDILINIIHLYNMVRNYLTQKPYSNEKVKINFECPTLLNGWDANKEKDYLGILFLKNDKYYLGIMDIKNRKIFDNIDESKDCNDYKKIIYKQIPNAAKYLSSKQILPQNPPENIVRILEKKKDDSNSLTEKEKNDFIDYCKNDFLKKYSMLLDSNGKSYFNFKFKNSNEYNRLNDFFIDVDNQAYSITYNGINENKINELIDEGKLYLFQIYNKDFSKFSKGKENLHTMYWKALFDADNIKNVIYKLNGKAEIFYRKASLKLKDTAIHPKNNPIKNKNEQNPKLESTFDYDLIKNKRYTVDKFMFHVPITINFINDGISNLNEIVNQSIKQLPNEKLYVIGIDRGERNLIYISVVDYKGNIVYQKSLNKIITDRGYNVDYHSLLNNKEIEREKSRESWQTVENIKELKKGYLSIVIHEITTLMEKYNAIIVLEDLNRGFKNSRIKIEKQVYQDFEHMLIDKLNYLIFKDKDKFDEGGLLNAYQLTNQFDSFKKMGKQSGVLFYIPAWCTSKIDPTTGFVNLFDFKYVNKNKAKDLIEKFEDIRFNSNKNYFEFDVDYSQFTDRSFGSIKNWTICTNGTRIKIYRNPEINNNFDSKEIILTDEFNKLFEKYDVDKNNIKESILSVDDSKFFEDLLGLLKLATQLRNSSSKTSDDYLISCVKNAQGEFYDSRNYTSGDILPCDADANGAYNIARKGLMLIDQIKNTDDSKLKKIDYSITNESWLKFVQNGEK